MSDQITEFEEVTPESLHLVGAPANGFPLLMLKASEAMAEAMAGRSPGQDRPTSKGHNMKKADKKAKKQLRKLARDIDLSGGASVSAQRFGDVAGAIARSGRQTRALHNTVLAQLDADVAVQRAKLASSDSDFARTAAQGRLVEAQRRRTMVKMVMAETAREAGVVAPSHLGRQAVDLFGGTSLSLPDDPTVQGVAGRRRP